MVKTKKENKKDITVDVLFNDPACKNMIGGKIAKLRKLHSMSQSQLADKMNELGHHINSTTICKIESFCRGVGDKELKSLSVIFGVSVDDFFKD